MLKKIFHNKSWLILLISLLGSSKALAFSFYEGSHWSLVPVPIFATSPGEGQTYGVMGAITASGPHGEVKSVISPTFIYNQVTGAGGFGLFYLYPDPDTFLSIYGELDQHFAREASFSYYHLPPHQGFFLYGGEVSYKQYPFERFFGSGPSTSHDSETNFVSEKVTTHEFVGYRLSDHWAVKIHEEFSIWFLHSKAIPEIADTLQVFAGNPEVVSSHNFIHRLELEYDTHANQPFSERGEMVSLAYLISACPLGSDFNFQGYNLHAKLSRGAKQSRFLTVVSGLVEQRFGTTIPFYLQSQLGGFNTLRAFVERRFSARHRIAMSMEERIEVLRTNLFNTKVNFSLDPFVDIGQVFNHISDVELSAFQVVGGMGLRMKAQPRVVARVDAGVGREGVEMNATIDYPF